MDDLFKIIFIVAILLGPAILKALNKSRGEDESESEIEVRLDEAIQKAKQQLGDRVASRSTPPPVAALPPSLQSKPSVPTTSPRRAPPPISKRNPSPLPPPPPAQSPSLAEQLEAMALEGEAAIVAAAKKKAAQLKQTAESTLANTLPKAQDQKFSKLMTMNAYELPIEGAKVEGLRARKAERSNPAVKSGLRQMVIHSEILQPPLSRRSRIGSKASFSQ